MITAAHLERRASQIMHACGGPPDRKSLANPSPAVTVAWDASHVGWHLMFARNHLGFLSSRYGKGVASLRWVYGAYRKDKARAKVSLHLAGDFMARAEAGFAALQRKAA